MGKDMLKTLIELLEHQESIKVSCTITDKHEPKKFNSKVYK